MSVRQKLSDYIDGSKKSEKTEVKKVPDAESDIDSFLDSIERQITREQHISVLGSTGSVGTQALDVARRQNFTVDFISAGSNTELAEKQIREFKPKFAAMNDEIAAEELRLSVADTATKVLSGSEGILEGIKETEKGGIVLNSISGFAGLLPTVTALENGYDLALANKESLVAAGSYVMKLAEEKECRILPVDSEHCAISQCISERDRFDVKRILLTASGGPFFGYSREKLGEVTCEQALNHPTWSMGKKVTVDSATLMNKGFEVLEASHLFGVSVDKITVVVHPESIIHSMVEFYDGAVMAQLANPDMRLCVSYAINRGRRKECGIKPLDFAELGGLTFRRPDTDTFTLLALAYKAAELGGNIPCAMNAANEIAVESFLGGKINLVKLSELVEKVTLDTVNTDNPSVSELIETDRDARERMKKAIAEI